MSAETAAQFPISTRPLDESRVQDALRSAYEGVDAEPGGWQRLTELLGTLLERAAGIVGERLGASGLAGVLGWVALIAVLGTAGWAVLWALRRIGLVSESSVRSEDAASAAVDWGAVAAGALERGDLSEATHACYRELLATLASQGWLTEQPGLTAGDCRRAARQIPGVYPAIESATRAFERVAYGNRGARDEDIALLRKARSLVATAPRRSSAAASES